MPALALVVARMRATSGGAVLGAIEALTASQAPAAMTAGPAHVAGVGDRLGALRPGMLADLAVLEPDALDGASPQVRPARLTIVDGEIVWRGASREPIDS